MLCFGGRGRVLFKNNSCHQYLRLFTFICQNKALKEFQSDPPKFLKNNKENFCKVACGEYGQRAKSPKFSPGTWTHPKTHKTFMRSLALRRSTELKAERCVLACTSRKAGGERETGTVSSITIPHAGHLSAEEQNIHRGWPRCALGRSLCSEIWSPLQPGTIGVA